ncbi:hypothetical protein NicSoilB11_26730 [Arthrobacter sp. NicSoilB11]|nr:hypothetical protein NicSoilB11_26730 [Arthrobacter sp. NicSoilB11]
MVRRQPFRRRLVDGYDRLRMAHGSTVLTASDISHFGRYRPAAGKPPICSYLKTRRGRTAVWEGGQSTVER